MTKPLPARYTRPRKGDQEILPPSCVRHEWSFLCASISRNALRVVVLAMTEARNELTKSASFEPLRSELRAAGVADDFHPLG
jgi:hypothetical protein